MKLIGNYKRTFFHKFCVFFGSVVLNRAFFLHLQKIYDMLFKKIKPLSCVCGSENTEILHQINNDVFMFCVQCGTQKTISKQEYLDEFDEWLSFQISKCETIVKLHKNKN